MNQLKVGLVGAGLIGKKRSKIIQDDTEAVLVGVADPNLEAIESLPYDKTEYGVYDDWKDLLNEEDLDVVIISTPNSFQQKVITVAAAKGLHCFSEKPLGRNVKESQEMVTVCEKNGVMLKTGFNHRFHPAIEKAKELVDSGRVGKHINIRARYGHGGRPGMEKEWRSSKILSGGGELLDQGVHIIDLIRWFSGEFTEIYGKVETKFWEIEVEDNAFAIGKTENGVSVSFHVSWTNWRNIFSFELFGTDGYLIINGLGGSYGAENLEWGRRKPDGGVPVIKYFDFDENDASWEKEWKDFRNALYENRSPSGSGIDGLKANLIVEALYRSSETNAVIVL